MDPLITGIFWDRLESEQEQLVISLDAWLLHVPGMSCKMRWRIPFYDRKKWICYLNPLKNGGIELCFLNGHLFENSDSRLDARGRKRIKGVTFNDVKEIDLKFLETLLQEALLLDEKL